MSELELLWMRPTSPVVALAKAAERLGLSTPVTPNEVPAIPLIDLDFCGSVVLTYDSGVLVSIEKRGMT